MLVTPAIGELCEIAENFELQLVNDNCHAIVSCQPCNVA